MQPQFSKNCFTSFLTPKNAENYLNARTSYSINFKGLKFCQNTSPLKARARKNFSASVPIMGGDM